MVRETTEADIRHVCAHLRAVDAEEQFATRFPGEDNPQALARDLIAMMPQAVLSFCFSHEVDETPAVILSAYLVSPGVARLHRIGTERWDGTRYEVFRFGIDRFMPALAAAVHRAECAILYRHDIARGILQRLGFLQECVALKRGRNGEDFANFAWVKS